jgi:hypothetical protein
MAPVALLRDGMRCKQSVVESDAFGRFHGESADTFDQHR